MTTEQKPAPKLPILSREYAAGLKQAVLIAGRSGAVSCAQEADVMAKLLAFLEPHIEHGPTAQQVAMHEALERKKAEEAAEKEKAKADKRIVKLNTKTGEAQEIDPSEIPAEKPAPKKRTPAKRRSSATKKRRK